MFENFPYTDMHQLNLDWIIKIAKDFLDQYTHIQELIANGEQSIQDLTDSSLEELHNQATTIENLLNQWYQTHSQELAQQLADALQNFNLYATNRGNEVIASIPEDYTALAEEVSTIDAKLYGNSKTTLSIDAFPNASQGAFIQNTPVGQQIITMSNAAHEIKYTDDVKYLRRVTINLNGSSGGLPIITFVNKSNAVVIAQYAPNPATNKLVVWVPNGLPDNTRMLINDFSYALPTRLISNIDLEYQPIDYKIVVGKNKIDNDNWGIGYGYNYGGGLLELATAISYGFNVTPGDVLRVAGVSAHITFWKDTKTFVSGTLDTTTTVPATATYCIISSTQSQIPTEAIATLNDADISYKPYTYKFRNATAEPTGKQYRDYAAGNLFFTVPVNQTVISMITGNTTDYSDTEDIINVHSVLRLPESYSATGEATPVIMIFHGSGFGVSQSAWGYSDGQGGLSPSIPFNNLINTFISAGYAVCDVNGYNNVIPCGTFGCAKDVLAHVELYNYVKRYYNVEDKFNLYGFSMGGVNTLNFARNFTDFVKSIAMGAPLIYLFDQVYNGAAHWKQQMAEGFGFYGTESVTFTDGAPTAQELALWNDTYNVWLRVGFTPESDIKTIDNTDYILRHMPPMRIWHGITDAVVSYTFTGSYVNTLRNAGQYAQIRYVNGAGHEVCYGDYPVINNEIVYWFNRMNK